MVGERKAQWQLSDSLIDQFGDHFLSCPLQIQYHNALVSMPCSIGVLQAFHLTGDPDFYLRLPVYFNT